MSKDVEVVGGPALALDKLIELARKGDYRALAVLYGQCSAFLEADGPVPEPLLSFMRERLKALSDHLAIERDDYRPGALEAIVGDVKRGRKADAPPLMPYTALESLLAAQVYFLKSGNLTERYEIVAEHFNKDKRLIKDRISDRTVKRAYEKLRKLGHHKP